MSARWTTMLALVIGVTAWAGAFCEPTAYGQFSGRGGGRHGGGGDRQSSPSDARRNFDFKRLPSQGDLTPHGGEYLSTERNYYEIVYMPLQTRIYLFDDKLKPLSARDVHVQMMLQLPMENVARRIPFQYVLMPVGATEQDYVVAVIDIRPLQDKETTVTFEFSGLSGRASPTASFSPHYASFAIRPYVAKVLLTQTDRDGISRQQVCPVTGAALGSRGPVVKLYLADFPLYVSGEDCIAAVKEAPEKYLPQPAVPMPGR